MLFFFSARNVSASSSALSSTSKMIASSMLASQGAPESQREIESRTFSDCAFGPHLPAMAVNNPLHRRQPDTAAGKLRSSVQPLKGSKQTFRMQRIEPHAVISHKIGQTAIAHRSSELDPGTRQSGLFCAR